MGASYRYTCQACRSSFSRLQGGGFVFDTFFCEDCGQQHRLSRSYLPAFGAWLSQEKVSPDRERWDLKLEELAGRCGCGGQLRRWPPPRCPHCKALVDDPGVCTHIID